MVDVYEENRRALAVEILGERLADKLLAAEASDDGVLVLTPDEFGDFLDRTPEHAPVRLVLKRHVTIRVRRGE